MKQGFFSLSISRLLLAVLLIITFFIIHKTVYGDSSDPNTTYSIQAADYNSTSGWYYNRSIDLNLSANGTNLPIKQINYWIDTFSPNITTINPAVVNILDQGEHTLYFYSTDSLNNEETPIEQFHYKLDFIAPNNWNNFSLTQSGNSHTFNASINVEDNTSGLDPTSAEFQYSVDNGTSWGYYSNLTSCSSSWNSNSWQTSTISPNTTGTTTATINIPTVDYCNSNWSQTKYLRIRIKDVAGNISTKQYALMSPWLKTTNGDVHSVGNINMTTENETGATGTISTDSTSINNFSSTQNWSLPNYSQNLSLSNFTSQYDKLINQATVLGSQLPTDSGVYYYNNNFVLNSSKIPSNLSTALNKGIIILITGNLYFDNNLITDPSTNIIWIATGDVGINKNADNIDSTIISGGKFRSTYNGNSSDQLTINGSIIATDTTYFDRSLNNSDNSNTPAEVINFKPNIFLDPFINSTLKTRPNLTWKEDLNL